LYRAKIEHATPHMVYGRVTETIRSSSIVPVLNGPVISSATM
jgi:hypothetical protein